MLMAGAAAGWVGYQFDLPWPFHLTLAILVGMAAGALWGGLAGLLKARTGAHEVIVTIMLNYVAFYLVFYALSEQSLLQAPGSANPKSLPMKDSATLPKLLGDRYNLHLGFLLALSPSPSSGGCSTGPPSASGSAPSARTRPQRAPRASTSVAPTSSSCSSPARWSVWRASTRSSAR